MADYLVPLLSVIGLCALWAVFQLWLAKHDPDAAKRSLKCGNCGCEKQCDGDYADDSGNGPRSGYKGPRTS